jgi:flagellar motility protein MotE (MotC chaperone)
VCIQTVFISPFTLIMQCFALLTLFLSTLASSVDAYAFSSPASVGATSRMAFRPSTCLRAESDSDDSGSDILNSPAFLTRKLEVLKSDLATAEESMAAATKKLEDGKAEWEKQFEDLKKEVRASY